MQDLLEENVLVDFEKQMHPFLIRVSTYANKQIASGMYKEINFGLILNSKESVLSFR